MTFEGTPNTEFRIGTDIQPMTLAEMKAYKAQLDIAESQVLPVFEPMQPRIATSDSQNIEA